jgi:hypothetical protein
MAKTLTPENIKHLEMIQGIITRMNTNSFQIKGFTVAIVSALLALYARNPNEWLIYIGIPPIIILWVLDSYYLQQERIFRGIYKDVISETPTVTFDTFEMPFDKYLGWKYHIVNSMVVSVNCFIYLAILGFIITFGLIIPV